MQHVHNLCTRVVIINRDVFEGIRAKLRFFEPYGGKSTLEIQKTPSAHFLEISTKKRTLGDIGPRGPTLKNEKCLVPAPQPIKLNFAHYVREKGPPRTRFCSSRTPWTPKMALFQRPPLSLKFQG